MKNIILFLLIMLIPLFLLANISTEIDFNSLAEEDFAINQEPGRPAIKYYPMKILMPFGHELSEIKLNFSQETRNRKELDFVQTHQPISTKKLKITKPIIENKFYPTDNYSNHGLQFKNGYAFLILNIFPEKYNPQTNELVRFSNCQINIKTTFNQELAQKENRKLIDSIELKNIYNKSAINSYQKTVLNPSKGIPNSSNPYEMIIITNNESSQYLNDFVAWKNEKGISTNIVLTSAIYSEYSGIDQPEQIRNYIIDAYETYSSTDTPLKYVILGGDDEIIPIRGTYANVGDYYDYNLPCDAYYSNLDGNWNANGNEIYGEIDDEVDYISEISIGRFPAESEEDFSNITRKIKHYSDTTHYTNDKAVFFGENLNWDILTWGGDYKDAVKPFLPENYTFESYYERDDNYSSQIVFNAINNGAAIMNHMGHANETFVFGQSPSAVDLFSNSEYGFIYTQGCYPAAFDQSTSGDGESVAEHLMFDDGGVHTFIGNTRYGWYSPGDTNGASQFYDISFFRGLFYENLRTLGSALSFSREDLVNEAMESSVMRWVHYELVIFGDPSLYVKEALNIFPLVTVGSSSFNELEGDFDGMINPGEKIELYFDFHNLEDMQPANNITVSISSDNPALQLEISEIEISGINPGDTISNTSNPFILSIDPTCSLGDIPLTLEVNCPIPGYDDFNKSYEKTISVTLNQTNWPWFSNIDITSAPLLADYNNDTGNEILLMDKLGNINLISSNGEQLNSFNIGNTENVYQTIAMGDLNNDSILDLVATSTLNKIFSINQLGELNFIFESSGMQICTPVIANFDNDNDLEILSIDSNKNLLILNYDGSLSNTFSLPEQVLHNFAVINLDNDNINEIVYIDLSAQLNIIDNQGNSAQGFPLQLEGQASSAPIVTDNNEIAISTNSHFYLLNSNADILVDKEINSPIANSPIIGNFDEDEDMEIAFNLKNGLVYIMEKNGQVKDNFPIDIEEQIKNPPLATDFTGDGISDLALFTLNSDFYLIENSGEIIYNNLETDSFQNNPGIIEDLDRDGDLEAICSTNNYIQAIDLPFAENIKTTDWVNYRRNYHRTANYNDNEFSGTQNEINSKILLKQNFPNPYVVSKLERRINPGTKINFELPNASEVNLSIYNIKGQLVKTLKNEKMEAGLNHAIWFGKNKQNKEVQSGVYFYKLKTENKVKVKKMLLLK